MISKPLRNQNTLQSLINGYKALSPNLWMLGIHASCKFRLPIKPSAIDNRFKNANHASLKFYSRFLHKCEHKTYCGKSKELIITQLWYWLNAQGLSLSECICYCCVVLLLRRLRRRRRMKWTNKPHQTWFSSLWNQKTTGIRTLDRCLSVLLISHPKIYESNEFVLKHPKNSRPSLDIIESWCYLRHRRHFELQI